MLRSPAPSHPVAAVRRPRAIWAVAAAAAIALSGLSACSPDAGPGSAAPETAAPNITAPDITVTRDVGVQMFQWTWTALARECTDTLGPAGYAWILTSPPQEHITGEAWWTAYQPVSYRVESRLGTREEFAAMVTSCHDAGVEVIADAVINHMSGQDVPGVGWAGSEYSHYDYPGLYADSAGDFHHCPTSTGDIANYDDQTQVQTCELVNLADLATGTQHVQDTIVAYLQDLVSLGVDGFRIDAAKHMASEDVLAIVSRLPSDVRVIQEVIRASGEPVQPEDYLESGRVFEFAFGKDVGGITAGTTFNRFFTMTEVGYLPSDAAEVFVDNHDTERNGSTLNYDDGARYVLANVLMLAGDYGTPVVYSGYSFSDTNAGPAQDADGAVTDAVCLPGAGPEADRADGDWVCQHRWAVIEGMIEWRGSAGDAPVANTWSEDDGLAFSRGDRAFVVVNRGDDALTGTWATGLVPGDYCDVAQGRTTTTGCAGETVTVADDGTATTTVPAGSAVAIHALARA